MIALPNLPSDWYFWSAPLFFMPIIIKKAKVVNIGCVFVFVFVFVFGNKNENTIMIVYLDNCLFPCYLSTLHLRFCRNFEKISSLKHCCRLMLKRCCQLMWAIYVLNVWNELGNVFKMMHFHRRCCSKMFSEHGKLPRWNSVMWQFLLTLTFSFSQSLKFL